MLAFLIGLGLRRQANVRPAVLLIEDGGAVLLESGGTLLTES